MIRKLSLAVAVATALSPVGALALGLGEIHPQSALNQAFKANIDLLSVSQEELQDVRVAREVKQLMRAALALYLGARPLRTREVLRQLSSLSRNSAADSSTHTLESQVGHY